jgi:hypothetical protein
MRLCHDVGPNFSLNEYANKGLPMSEETTHRPRGIERNPVTKDPLAKALSDLSGAAWRRRGNQQRKVAPVTQQVFNERRDRQRLTNRDRMNPYQLVWPRLGRGVIPA